MIGKCVDRSSYAACRSGDVNRHPAILPLDDHVSFMESQVTQRLKGVQNTVSEDGQRIDNRLLYQVYIFSRGS
jgi:hypothetical protein